MRLAQEVVEKEEEEAEEKMENKIWGGLGGWKCFLWVEKRRRGNVITEINDIFSAASFSSSSLVAR